MLKEAPRGSVDRAVYDNYPELALLLDTEYQHKDELESSPIFVSGELESEKVASKIRGRIEGLWDASKTMLSTSGFRRKKALKERIESSNRMYETYLNSPAYEAGELTAEMLRAKFQGITDGLITAFTTYYPNSLVLIKQ